MQIVKQTIIALVLGCMVIGSLVTPVLADDVFIDGKIITAENYDSAALRESEEPDDIATEETEESEDESVSVQIPSRIKRGT